MIKIPGCGVGVLPDKFVGSGAGGQELSNRHPVNEHFFLSCFISILNLLILQKTCKIFVIPLKNVLDKENLDMVHTCSQQLID